MALMTQVGIEFIARDRAGGVIGSLNQSLGSFGRTLSAMGRVGGIAWMSKSFMDSATAMMKARREGESLIAAFASGIPIVNRFAESLTAMAEELSGVAAYKEAADSLKKFWTESEKLKESLRQSIELQGVSAERAKELRAGYDYMQVMQQINTLKEHTREVLKHNAALDEQIAKLKELQAQASQKREFAIGGFGAMGAAPKAAPEYESMIKELESRKLPETNLAELYEMAEKKYRSDLAKANEKSIKDSNKAILDDTRNMIDSIRSMDYLTRQEKIQNLKIYLAEHAETLSQVADAEKLLNDEIITLQRSRMDAMKIYQAELRDDMQNLNLYISEKFAEVARSIEGSMAGAFQSLIAEGASWRDAMNQFFRDVGDAFAKMAAEMAARAIMANIMGAAVGGAAGGVSGNAAYSKAPYPVHHRGGFVGEITAMRELPAAAFIGAPRLHGGGLLGDEMPIIAQKGEYILPKGQAPVTNNYYNNISAIDTQSFQQALGKQKNFLTDLNYSSMKSNHPQRRFER